MTGIIPEASSPSSEGFLTTPEEVDDNMPQYSYESIEGYENTPEPMLTIWLGFINTPEFENQGEYYQMWLEAWCDSSAVQDDNSESWEREIIDLRRRWLIRKSDEYMDTETASWFDGAADIADPMLPGIINRTVRIYQQYVSDYKVVKEYAQADPENTLSDEEILSYWLRHKFDYLDEFKIDDNSL